jgi:SAM-dependent methyltransferase
MGECHEEKPMNEDQPIPFWGPEQLDLFELMSRAIDQDQRISAAMQTLAPLENRVLLDIGAGVGDRTILYARLAAHVYALEPDPAALPILRGRIRSSGATNITVVPGTAEAVPLETDCADVAYATWSYFFGAGSEPGLAEIQRVVRPGGDMVVVQNYGHDELCRFWDARESECERWPPWFAEKGFSCTVVDTTWHFQTLDEASIVLEFLWGQRARTYAVEHNQTEFAYRVAIYHQRVTSPTSG